MFTVSLKESFVWPVSFRVPTDGGGYIDANFDAEFKRLSQTRLEEITEKLTAGMMNDRQVAEEVLVGWNGVQTEDGGAVPFTKASKARLLDIAGLASALVLAFTDALRGARTKN